MSKTQKHIQKIKADKLICNNEYKVFPQIICNGWGCAWKHTLISLCPPRSWFQNEVRYTRDLSREQPMKANEESFWGGWKNLQTMIQFFFFFLRKARRGREGKMISESHAVLKIFWQSWQSPLSQNCHVTECMDWNSITRSRMWFLQNQWRPKRHHACLSVLGHALCSNLSYTLEQISLTTAPPEMSVVPEQSGSWIFVMLISHPRKHMRLIKASWTLAASFLFCPIQINSLPFWVSVIVSGVSGRSRSLQTIG